MEKTINTNKKKNAVVFGLTINHLFAVASVMMDLKKHCPNIADEIVIFCDNEIKDDDKVLLSSILPTRFIIYNFPIKDTTIFNQGTFKYFSKMVFSKYECLRLLNEYENVLWLDYDIVVTKDISELMTTCDSGIKMMSSPGCPVRSQLHEPISDYNMEAEAICASTFVLQDHLKDYMKLYEFCYAKLEKYAKYLYFGEQAIFDFMIQEFNLEISPISNDIYSPHPTDLGKIEKAKILHAYGQPKFWNGLENNQWNINYKNWLAMGGTGKTTDPLRKRIFFAISNLKKTIIQHMRIITQRN